MNVELTEEEAGPFCSPRDLTIRIFHFENDRWWFYCYILANGLEPGSHNSDSWRWYAEVTRRSPGEWKIEVSKREASAL